MPIFFHPDEDVAKHRSVLPHWQQDGATYFLTFRQTDAVPYEKRCQWMNERDVWMIGHPKPWTSEVEMEYHQKFTRAMEEWLDAGTGSCLLRREDCRAFMMRALMFFDGKRYRHYAWVVMPNYVHCLVSLLPGSKLEEILHSWKRHAARQINLVTERNGEFWQRDYYNRIIRDKEHFGNVLRYIKRNPLKAKLREDEYALYVDPAAREYLSQAP